VDQLLRDRSVLIPVEVFVQMGLLAQADYEAWRFASIPYLERAVKCNLTKANHILRILQLVTEDRGLRPSRTVYKKRGKGEKIGLRFSKNGNPAVEELYMPRITSQGLRSMAVEAGVLRGSRASGVPDQASGIGTRTTALNGATRSASRLITPSWRCTTPSITRSGAVRSVSR
jgi:hypothetical protein